MRTLLNWLSAWWHRTLLTHSADHKGVLPSNIPTGSGYEQPLPRNLAGVFFAMMSMITHPCAHTVAPGVYKLNRLLHACAGVRLWATPRQA